MAVLEISFDFLTSNMSNSLGLTDASLSLEDGNANRN